MAGSDVKRKPFLDNRVSRNSDRTGTTAEFFYRHGDRGYSKHLLTKSSLHLPRATQLRFLGLCIDQADSSANGELLLSL
eukprot:COSAG02_NODE_772_length_17359_cov_74.661587_15_plen_79_part_00